MDYIIHHKSQMASKLDTNTLEDKVNQLLSKTDHFSSSYHKPLTLTINFSEEGDGFMLSFETQLKSSTVHVSKNGSDVNEVFDLLSDSYLRSLKRQIHKERKEQRRKHRQASTETIEQVLNTAGISRNLSKEEYSSKIHTVLLQEIKSYVASRLLKAEAAKLIDKNKYTVNDILDQIFVKVYEIAEANNFVKFNIKNIALKEAHTLIKGLFKEHEFEQNHVLHLEQQLERENSKLREKIFVDAMGKTELEAEFQEPNCHVNYHSEDVFDDPEDALIHNIDLQIGRDKVKELLAIEVMKLNPLDHAIYDHAIIEEMPLQDIASIYDIEIEEVEKVVVAVKTHLRHALRAVEVPNQVV